MHDIDFTHKHELDSHNFLGCCKDCQDSLNIIKPHIMAFAKRIKEYNHQMLEALDHKDLYRLYQLLDDLAHMDAGPHLAALILDEPAIRAELPMIRSYYSTFFSIHEKHLAEELLKSDSPWETLQSFPLYPRYEILVKNQVEALGSKPGSTMAFIGCGPVPITLILMSRLYGIRSIGIDSSREGVTLGQKVLKALGLENEVRIVHGDESCLRELSWDTVLVAALSEPKSRIFLSLRDILMERNLKGPVIYRTYTGMRAVLYEPVRSEDTEGFKIVKNILPTGRVNNTTVFAELDS